MAVEEHQPLGRRRRDAAADVVEHRQQRVGRQPDRAGRPGVLVRLRVRERWAAATRRARRRRVRPPPRRPRSAMTSVGVERQVRAVLLDRAERLDEDAALGDPIRRPPVPRRSTKSAADGPWLIACVTSIERTASTLPGAEWRHACTAISTPSSSEPATTVSSAAAYLARAGMRTLLVEARDDGRRHRGERAVRRRHGQHLQLRPPHVPHHPGDGGTAASPSTGSRYLDVDPSQHNMAWDGGAGMGQRTTTSRRRSTRSAASLPDRGRRLPPLRCRRRCPAVRMMFEAANEPPSITGLATKLALRRRLAGSPPLLRWSRRSAADVMREFFDHRRAARARRR